jgi:hypothetical protein
MWRRVDIVLTDVSEERIASIFRVEKNGENPQAKKVLLTLVLCLWLFFFLLP